MNKKNSSPPTPAHLEQGHFGPLEQDFLVNHYYNKLPAFGSVTGFSVWKPFIVNFLSGHPYFISSFNKLTKLLIHIVVKKCMDFSLELSWLCGPMDKGRTGGLTQKPHSFLYDATKLKHVYSPLLDSALCCICKTNYNRTSMARTPLEPWKYVRDMGSSSKWGLITAPGQGAKKGYLFDFLQLEGILCVLIRIASWRRS